MKKSLPLSLALLVVVSVAAEPADADWQAKWVCAATDTASVVVRREFTVQPGLRRASIRVCGLGEYELTLNGQKVGEDLFPPGWTNTTRPVFLTSATSRPRCAPARTRWRCCSPAACIA